MTTPAWRNFEKLVSRIERTLAGESVTVTSPDSVPCVTTGTPREVDASIRTRVGSAAILVTVECRDRVAVQDVTWIEQLAAKKNNIGAARTIAVAAAGFSAEAKRIARENAIDLRILDEITEEDIKGWNPPVELIHLFRECELLGTTEVILFELPGDEPQELMFPENELGSQRIFLNGTGEPLSLNDIWLCADNQMKLFDKVPTDNKDHFLTLEISPSNQLQLITQKGNRQVESIKMSLRLRWKQETISLADAKIVSYKPADAEDQFPGQMRVEFETKGAIINNLRFGFQQKQGDTSAILSLQLIDIEPASSP